MAVFEIIPGSDKLFHPDVLEKDVVASIEMRYSLCDDTTQLQLVKDCINNYTDFELIDKDLQFATAVICLL
ncbi:MAG: hypothetical protein R2765_07395 [Ferruginibacter sp.]